MKFPYVWRLRLAFFCSLTLALAACGGGGGSGNGEQLPDEPDPIEPTEPVGAPTEVGRPVGAAVTATIGSLGGSLSSADGRLAVHVPAGALDRDVELSLLPIENKAHGGRGDAFRLTPEGLSFALPVQLVFGYGADDLAGTAADALGVAYQRADRTWEWAGAPQVDTTARTVTVETTHFSDWSLVAGLQLQPRAATVKTGESLTLRVVDCYPAPAEEDGLVPLGMRCDGQSDDGLAPLWFVQEWAVNGSAGGSGVTGTVAKIDQASARFNAPGRVPNPDTVTVSARVDQGSAARLLLAAEVRIVDDNGPDYAGTLTMSNALYDMTAEVAWTLYEDLGDVRSYLPSGTITVTLKDPTCNPGPYRVPIASGTPDDPAGSLVVYTASNSAYPRQHMFTVGGTGSVTVTCGDGSTELNGDMFQVAPYYPCLEAVRHPYGDESVLSGSFSCFGVDQVSWTFQRRAR